MVDVLQTIKKNVAAIVPEDGLAGKLEQAKRERRPLIIKLGLDPTAPDIHLGHSVVLRKLRQFQDAGQKVVLIVGDYTATIGDPSGRSRVRPLLSDAQIKKNAGTYAQQAGKILKTSKDVFALRYNKEWLAKLKLDDLLKLMAKVTVAQILDREDFQKRMKAGESLQFHELLYPLLQAQDSVAIKADIELGGTDQTFNLLMGRQLQTALGLDPQVVITMPLISGTDGKKKMSKSLGNSIGVTDEPNDMFGKVMSIPDNLMEQYTTLCTDLTWNDLKGLKPMDAKKKLAREIVTLYHGNKSAAGAERSFASAFQQKEFPQDAPELTLRGKTTLLKFLILHKVFTSNSEARRKIQEGAIHIDGKQIKDAESVIEVPRGASREMKIGKRGFYRISGQEGNIPL